MKINYGVNRRVAAYGRGDRSRVKKIEHKNGKLVLRGASWGDEGLHDRVVAAIKRKHPGWQLTGYCEAPR